MIKWFGLDIFLTPQMCFPTIIFITLGSYVKVGWEMSSISKDEVYVLYMEKRNRKFYQSIIEKGNVWYRDVTTQ